MRPVRLILKIAGCSNSAHTHTHTHRHNARTRTHTHNNAMLTGIQTLWVSSAAIDSPPAPSTPYHSELHHKLREANGRDARVYVDEGR